MITKEQLIKIWPYSKAKVDLFLPHLIETMAIHQIDTKPRIAAFLAQVGHESGQLRYVQEIASGAAYEGRKDLGNTFPGDGVKFKGRGLIQITGRANYTSLMMALEIDCLEHPEVLEEPRNACRSAGWFWSTKKLNQFADSGDFVTLTKRVNGGTNGLEDRQEIYARALAVL